MTMNEPNGAAQYQHTIHVSVFTRLFGYKTINRHYSELHAFSWTVTSNPSSHNLLEVPLHVQRLILGTQGSGDEAKR
jgi:hypothetical protein